MSIVTGDRYLESLVQFVERTAGHLIEGTLVLKLNPVGLHYVQSRLEALSELESLLDGAPVDYLRAYISDLGDHRALEQLRRILRLLTSLKVVSVLPPPIRDPTPLSLLPFERLRVLELRGCDLSTSAARGLLELRHTLEKFICHNSTDALRHVFASRIAEIKDSPQWNRLSSVSCACNGLVLMDESLQLLPVVETLDLSRNRFTRVDNLRKCVKLKHLDLGFNLLRTIASLKELSCRLVKLVLRNNALTTLRGIENLSALEGLDLSYNILSNFSELEILSGLSSLKSLWLEGNPLCCARWYRAQVFSFFPHPVEMELDDKKLCRREYWKRHIIIASRQKRPASFGYYFTAKDNARSEAPINIKPRKISRLANIENEDPSAYICSDQESVVCENEVQDKVENRLDDEDEIVDLMNKIEFMKRERSVQWLDELKEWINRDPKTSADGAKYSGNNLIHVHRNCLESKTRHKAESSKYVADSAQASGTERDTYTLESDEIVEDTSAGFSGGKYFDKSGEATTKLFMGHSDVDGIPFVGGSDLSQGRLQSSHIEGASSIQAESSYLVSHLPEDDRVKMKKTIRPLAAIDDIMESQSSSFCLGSPPHYKEDILQRRQNLEEELLQLPTETYSVASTDSNTSCSDDDSAECQVYTPVTDTSCIGDSSDRSVDDLDFSVYSGETSFIKRRDVSEVKQNGDHLLDSDAQHDSGIVEDGELNPSQLVCDYSFSARGNDTVCPVNQDADYLQKRKCKRKSKRRVVSLTDRNNMDDAAAAADRLDRSPDALRDDMLDITKRQVSINNEISTCANAVTASHSKDSGNIISAKLGSVGTDDLIVNHFNSNLADTLVNETCRQYVRCNSVLEANSECKESELVVLRSSEQKLYMLLISNGYDGSDATLSLIGCHNTGDVREVLVGLGLQIVRVYIGKDGAYQFVTRSLEKSRQLFCILDIFDSYNTEDCLTLRSLEHVQVDLFSRNFFGGSHMSIFQYSMVLYWRCTFEDAENAWLSRSLFVLERYLLVCIEDMSQFGSLTDISPYGSYFSLDSCCSVVDVLEMVIETKESFCVTLALKKVLSKPCNENATDQVDETAQTPSAPLTWKLRWFSEESLFQFVALLRALHNTATSSPLVVMYMS